MNATFVDMFFGRLQARQSSARVRNLYQAEGCLWNLSHYLGLIEQGRSGSGSLSLLLGEAPGHLGCGRVGVPFTSGEVMAVSPLFAPIRKHLYFEGEWKEASASIVYRIFAKGPAAWHSSIFWNAFPFHPHPEGNAKANRRPSALESEEGLWYIRQLLANFPIARVLAIGRVAEKSAKKAAPSLPTMYLRHPSHGGAKAFESGVRAAFPKAFTMQPSLQMAGKLDKYL